MSSRKWTAVDLPRLDGRTFLVTGANSGIGLVAARELGHAGARVVLAVREGGLLVTIAGAPPEEAARGRGVRAELLVMSPKADQLARIAELVAGGDVRVEIAEAMPLADVKRAHELSESGHVRGKLVLTLA